MDTTSERASVAIVEGERVIEEVALRAGRGSADAIFGEIESLLQRNGLKLADIGGFASASGPGTFTGVRVGLTVVKGLAEALARRVVAVSNLRAMAFFGTRPLRAPMMDARRGEIYGAVYDSALELVGEEVVMEQEAWIASLPEGAEILSELRPLAGAIGKIAASGFAGGRAMDAAFIDANYVRRPDAEIKAGVIAV